MRSINSRFTDLLYLLTTVFAHRLTRFPTNLHFARKPSYSSGSNFWGRPAIAKARYSYVLLAIAGVGYNNSLKTE